MAELKISTLGSLNFDHDWRRSFQKQVCYMQKFTRTDTIRVQYSVSIDNTRPTSVVVRDIQSGYVAYWFEQELVDLNDNFYIYDVTLFHPVPGCYALEILCEDELIARALFQVVPELTNSLLFKYTNWRDDFGHVFNDYLYFRVEGTTLPQDVVYSAENNTFRDQNYNLHTISGYTSQAETLTIGGCSGVPQWVASKINNILACSDVSVNGRSIVRSEGSAPAITILNSMHPLYRYKVEVEGKSDGNITIDLREYYRPLHIVLNNKDFRLLTGLGDQLFVK